MSDFQTIAWVRCRDSITRQIDVTVSYEESDGRPIVYGVFDLDKDVTGMIEQPEYDVIYSKLETHLNEMMTEAGELAKERKYG